MDIFFKTFYKIFSVYPLPEALLILGNYLRIIVRNRLPFVKQGEERILSYIVGFPHRPQFFGMLSEIFFHCLYRLPNREIYTITDAGANIGWSTLYFKWRYPEASILCFEPNPEVIGFLKKNIARNNLMSVKIFPFALGKKNDEAELFTDPLIKGSSSATTVPPEKMGQEIHSHHVPMHRLSNFIDSPVDLLKLDVEGAEADILEDLEETRKLSLISDMIIEYHMYDRIKRHSMGDFLSILERNGFKYSCYPQFSEMNDSSSKGMYRYMVHAYRPYDSH